MLPGVPLVKRLIVLAALLACGAVSLHADVFRFAYTKGEKYRILSQVHESVSVNGQFNHDVDILNKIAVAVTDTKGDAGYNVVDFQTSERSYGSQSTYAWTEEYPSEFWRDGRGAYTIDPSYFMPGGSAMSRFSPKATFPSAGPGAPPEPSRTISARTSASRIRSSFPSRRTTRT